MSRKDLSRTVIEGGRYYSNSYFRRASNGDERASTREWIERVRADIEEAEGSLPLPRKRVGKMFHDKLAPAQRWLRSQVGRPWSRVYAELRAKFDSRTVAGRHVVEDHMLTWVIRHDDVERFRYRSRFQLVIDAHGILREPMWNGRSYAKLAREVVAWASGRVCARTFRGWWWFRKEGSGAECAMPWKCRQRPHYEVRDGRAYRTFFHAIQYVPLGGMSAGQVRYLERLPPDLRGPLVVASQEHPSTRSTRSTRGAPDRGTSLATACGRPHEALVSRR